MFSIIAKKAPVFKLYMAVFGLKKVDIGMDEYPEADRNSGDFSGGFFEMQAGRFCGYKAFFSRKNRDIAPKKGAI